MGPNQMVKVCTKIASAEKPTIAELEEYIGLLDELLLRSSIEKAASNIRKKPSDEIIIATGMRDVLDELKLAVAQFNTDYFSVKYVSQERQQLIFRSVQDTARFYIEPTKVNFDKYSVSLDKALQATSTDSSFKKVATFLKVLAGAILVLVGMIISVPLLTAPVGLPIAIAGASMFESLEKDAKYKEINSKMALSNPGIEATMRYKSQLATQQSSQSNVEKNTKSEALDSDNYSPRHQI